MPATIKDLKADLRGFPRNPNSYPYLRVRYYEVAPFAGMRSVVFSGVVEPDPKTENPSVYVGSGKGSKEGREPVDSYLVQIKFTGLEFFKEKPKGPRAKSFTLVTIESDGDKSPWWMEIPVLGQHNVLVKCQCDDFRFRFEHQASRIKALIGRFRKYKRKTPPPPVGYPYANPNDVTGYCKHVSSFVRALRDSGEVRG